MRGTICELVTASIPRFLPSLLFRLPSLFPYMPSGVRGGGSEVRWPSHLMSILTSATHDRRLELGHQTMSKPSNQPPTTPPSQGPRLQTRGNGFLTEVDGWMVETARCGMHERIGRSMYLIPSFLTWCAAPRARKFHWRPIKKSKEGEQTVQGEASEGGQFPSCPSKAQ